MCGRFSLGMDGEVIRLRFNIDAGNFTYIPTYNCAPSQKLAVITNEYPGMLNQYRWGLVPFWAKDISIGSKLINAKAESVAEKPSFRNSFKSRRCLVPADSYYEWKQDKEKKPYRILLKSEEPFSMAGLWDSWKDSEGREIRTFTILTIAANELIKSLHHRMPVILRRTDENKWLDNTAAQSLIELFRPYDPDEMKYYEISNRVNSPVNNDPGLHKAV